MPGSARSRSTTGTVLLDRRRSRCTSRLPGLVGAVDLRSHMDEAARSVVGTRVRQTCVMRIQAAVPGSGWDAVSVAARQQSDRTGPVESGKASGRTPKRPSAGHSGWLVGLIWLATVVLTVLALALLVATLPVPTFGRIGSAYGQQTVFAGAGAACTLAFATVGATIVWHRRRHLVGWLFCLVGLALAIQAFAGFYATYALVTSPGSLPGGQMMGWLGSWTAVPAILLIPLFCFLLFPDGRLPGPRWRIVAWFDGLTLAMMTVGVSFSAGPLAVLPSVANPLAPPAMAGRLAGGILIAGALLVPVAVAASVGSLIVRLRRARGHSASSSSGSPAQRRS